MIFVTVAALLAVGMYARYKGRSALLWFFGTFFFMAVIGLFCLLVFEIPLGFWLPIVTALWTLWKKPKGSTPREPGDGSNSLRTIGSRRKKLSLQGPATAD